MQRTTNISKHASLTTGFSPGPIMAIFGCVLANMTMARYLCIDEEPTWFETPQHQMYSQFDVERSMISKEKEKKSITLSMNRPTAVEWILRLQMLNELNALVAAYGHGGLMNFEHNGANHDVINMIADQIVLYRRFDGILQDGSSKSNTEKLPELVNCHFSINHNTQNRRLIL